MTKEQRSEAIRITWDGMEEMHKRKEKSESIFQEMLFETFYKIFYVLYLLVIENKRKGGEK